MVVSACLFTDAGPVSSPAPSPEELCSWTKSVRCVGLPALVQVGYCREWREMEHNCLLYRCPPFVLKQCHPPYSPPVRKGTKADVLKIDRKSVV